VAYLGSKGIILRDILQVLRGKPLKLNIKLKYFVLLNGKLCSYIGKKSKNKIPPYIKGYIQTNKSSN